VCGLRPLSPSEEAKKPRVLAVSAAVGLRRGAPEAFKTQLEIAPLAQARSEQPVKMCFVGLSDAVFSGKIIIFLNTCIRSHVSVILLTEAAVSPQEIVIVKAGNQATPNFAF